MADREKLIELLFDCDELITAWGGSYAEAADHLLANGVTFGEDTNVPSKWIPVTERLPQDRGETCKNVILMMDNGLVTVGWLNQITDRGYYLDTINDFVTSVPLSRFTNWMPLPEPPKEE